MNSQLEILFEIFGSFFEPKMVNIIQNFKGEPIQLVGDLMKSFQSPEEAQKKLALYNIVTKFRQCVKNQLQAQMLGLIYHCGKKSSKNENYLYYMLCDLAVNFGYDLPYEILEECIYFVLQFQRTLPSWVIHQKKIEEHYEENLKRSNEERSFIAVNLLKKARPYLSEKKVEELIELVDRINL